MSRPGQPPADRGSGLPAALKRVEQRLGVRSLVAGAFLVALLLGVVDHWTGPEISFSIFYLGPVGIAAWVGGGTAATVAAIWTAGIWLAADVTTGHVYSDSWIPLWNAAVRMGFFLVVGHLLVSLRRSHAMETLLADTDELTGIANRRCFFERLDRELARSRRTGRPVTLAYVDLDGFKGVNDREGHAEGDRVLVAVARTLDETTRETDVAARIGGDEFALLLPETGEEVARPALAKVHRALAQTASAGGWPVGFSVGALTFPDPPESASEAVRTADTLMYRVKWEDKGRLRFLVWEGEAVGAEVEEVARLREARSGA